MNVRALVLGLSLLAVSCGAPPAETTTATDGAEAPASTTLSPTTTAPTVTTSTTEALPVGSSKSLARLLRAAEQTQTVESMSITLTAEMTGLADMEGTAGFSMRAALNTDGTGVVSFDLGAMLAAIPADELEAAGPAVAMFENPIEMRVTEHVTYMSSSFFSWIFPVETPWIAAPTGSDTAPGFADDPPTADQFLPVLYGLDDDVEEVGREDVLGVPTTHYRGRFSVERLAELGADFDISDFDLTDTGALTADVLDIEVWIDDDDLVRRLRFGVDDLHAFDPSAAEGAAFWFTIELADFDKRVVVEIPAPEDVTEIDDIFG